MLCGEDPGGEGAGVHPDLHRHCGLQDGPKIRGRQAVERSPGGCVGEDGDRTGEAEVPGLWNRPQEFFGLDGQVGGGRVFL